MITSSVEQALFRKVRISQLLKKFPMKPEGSLPFSQEAPRPTGPYPESDKSSSDPPTAFLLRFVLILYSIYAYVIQGVSSPHVF
jgi:hypothetical protein